MNNYRQRRLELLEDIRSFSIDFIELSDDDKGLVFALKHRGLVGISPKTNIIYLIYSHN